MNEPLDRFLDLLVTHPLQGSANLFNPWRDHDPQNDLAANSPNHRLDHLTRYLKARLDTAKVLLVAEAPGYCGGKFSGLAMTSERDLLSSADLLDDRFFDGPKARTSKANPVLKNETGMLERTASIVWGAMMVGGFGPREFVLWNSHAYHPHAPGNRLSNRAPTRTEVETALPVLRAFLDVFPGRPVLAIGQVCQRTLAAQEIKAIGARHLSYGGAPEFRATIRSLRGQLA